MGNSRSGLASSNGEDDLATATVEGASVSLQPPASAEEALPPGHPSGEETTTASEASNEVVLAGEDQQQAPEAMSTSVHANSGEAEKTKHEKNTEVVNASVDKTCGICLEDSKDPLNLPCGHSFCEGCLNEWRSRYGVKEEMRRKCPICRARIPPSKEMVATLLQWRAEKERMEVNNETYSKSYRRACEFLKDAEEKVGKDWDGETVLQDRNNKQAVAMPDYVMMAIKKGDIKSVLRWINADRTEDRASAVSAEMMGLTALMLANLESNLTLMTLLLQLGADVNYRVSLGYSLIDLALNDVHVDARAHKVVRMLLSWGATFISENEGSKENNILKARVRGDHNLANLLESELGGRRCEIINLTARPELNGKTCVVDEYLPNSNQYNVMLETKSKEVLVLRPDNLKRRDRTPQDCGYYIEFKNGRTIRHVFDSSEDCKAFVAALNKGDSQPVVTEEAEARAEQAAAELLAELGLDDSTNNVATRDSQVKKTKKKKRGKKNKK